MTEYFERQRQIEADMCFRNPWFNLFYNWLIGILIIALAASFVWWGIDIHRRNRDEQIRLQVLAEMDAEHAEMMAAAEAQEAERKASLEYVMDQESTAVAKAFYGIVKFLDKYHYTEADLETYARCMFNRAEGGDLITEISKPEQFTGYNDSNPVLAEYKNLAQRLVEEWHSETIKPCDVSFRFAELTPNGIYLKQDLHADGYARRWHA